MFMFCSFLYCFIYKVKIVFGLNQLWYADYPKSKFHFINDNGEFIGGAIASGIETSAAYLIQKAALLSKTDLKFPENVIGVDTKENIQSGIMYGALDQVEGMIKRISNESDEEYNIILTGGLSTVLSPYLSLEHTLDLDLTLKGMIYIDEDN